MRGRRYFTEFLPTWSTSRLERGWYQTTNATKGLPYSPMNITPMGSIHTSTIGALVGGNRNLSQGWTLLHNLIGGSQQKPPRPQQMPPRPQCHLKEYFLSLVILVFYNNTHIGLIICQVYRRCIEKGFAMVKQQSKTVCLARYQNV